MSEEPYNVFSIRISFLKSGKELKMALIHCNFYSEVLGLSTSMDVILPQQTTSQIGMQGKVKNSKHPTLYLLHGLSDDQTIWQRRTAIERYVANIGLAVVMPSVARSWYADMVDGPKYWTFISEELPVLARSFFPLSDRREDNFVAGLSMGGYGAFKLALRCPENFAAAASLSGAMDPYAKRENWPAEFRYIFGDEPFAGSLNDLFHVASENIKKGTNLPRLYQWCGTSDFLYQDNLRFRDHARKLGLDLTYEEGPGDHAWEHWDRQIQRVLQWLAI
jgi:S-formylglutathione hydrolase FrmB